MIGQIGAAGNRLYNSIYIPNFRLHCSRWEALKHLRYCLLKIDHCQFTNLSRFVEPKSRGVLLQRPQKGGCPVGHGGSLKKSQGATEYLRGVLEGIGRPKRLSKRAQGVLESKTNGRISSPLPKNVYSVLLGKCIGYHHQYLSSN